MSDMEELLESICDEQIKKFMREAYLCYMASAYKACIIMSFISVYEDLRKKIKELSTINSDARDITREIETRISSNQVYESFLENQLISKNIIEANAGRDLEIIRDRRNLCAHPTSHIATAEEARYIYSLVIKTFLSKPLLKTIDRVNYIIDDLRNDNFFPSNMIDKITFIVSPILKTLHINIYPYLLKELLNKIKEVDTNSNYHFFLSGIVNASLIEKELENPLITHFIDKKANDSFFEKAIITALNINSNLYCLSNDSSKNRIKVFLKNKITNLSNYSDSTLINPIFFLLRLADKKGEEYTLNHLKEEITILIQEKKYNPKTIILIKKLPSLQNEYISEMISDAGSPTYNVANKFARKIIEIENEISKLMNEQECFTLIIKCFKSANRGAYHTENLVSRKFDTIPNILEKAKRWAYKNKKIAFDICSPYAEDYKNIDEFIEEKLS